MGFPYTCILIVEHFIRIIVKMNNKDKDIVPAPRVAREGKGGYDNSPLSGYRMQCRNKDDVWLAYFIFTPTNTLNQAINFYFLFLLRV